MKRLLVSRRVRLVVTGLLLPVLSGAAVLEARGQDASAAATDGRLYQGMKWRNIGPFRGGRAGAVTGVPGNAMTYYMGTAGGGVWKTTDAGITWRNVSDGFVGTASVGAIAVAPSDANVVYVGMGENSPRGVTTSHGDGVYRSTDAGRTWKRVGLEASRAVSRIRVHPRDPDHVYVAVQGSPYMPTQERGIYRSRDGGGSWEQVLFVSDAAGASDLAMDRSNPRILYAAFWDHQRMPWQIRSGGEGSGIWKSKDGGDTWERLSSGLPDLMGKVAVDVSAANPDRLWAMVEAEPDGGVYRSDDAGATWRRVNSTRGLRSRPWYYIELYADPVDENTVYVLNAPLWKSIDGGRTFERLRQGHGDNHDLWINPEDNRNLISANDGGGQVTFNGGASWSSLDNQPTAQFYRVNTDNLFPYNVYGGQQDNSSVKIASRTFGGGITERDWSNAAGCESAYLAFDPDDPRYVYGGCYLGQIDELDTATGNSRDVQALPGMPASIPAREMTYRFNWNAPIVADPHDAGVIYHGSQKLLRSADRGITWDEISPDLTRNDDEKQGAGGAPITNEGAGGEVYGTLVTVAPSPLAPGVIWTGSDDGYVQVTRDGGTTWANVTPPGLPEAQVNAIDASPHDAASAWVAVTRYKFNDFTPHVFHTSDYGATWTRLVEGIGEQDWVRVVREDPARPGLLYAGTETGAYVSFDAGAHWQSLRLNLPVVPVTDLKVQDDDLVAATQGRAFWILDDLGPLREASAELAGETLHLFAPSPAYRIGGGGGFGVFGGGAVGTNPPGPAVIDFWIGEEALAGDAKPRLELLDAEGGVIRTVEGRDLDASAGHNRFSGPVRYEDVVAVPGLFVFGSLNGRRVPPGEYRVRLSLGDQSRETTLTVLGDPRVATSAADWEAREAFLVEARETLTDVHESVIRLQEVRSQIDALSERLDDAEALQPIRDKAKEIVDGLTAVDEQLVQRNWTSGQDPTVFATRLNQFFMYVRSAVEGSEEAPTNGARKQLAMLTERWRAHEAELARLLGPELDELNALVRELGIPAIAVKGGQD